MDSPQGTREQLISATREAIRDVGLPSLTVREIVGRASANLASIPYHFGSKSALVAEALVAEVRELIAPVLVLLASDRPPADRAGQAIAVLNELFDRNRAQIPVYLAALAESAHSPDVRDGLAGLWREVRTRLADDISRQIEFGQLPDWVSPDAMAALISAVVNGVVIASVVDAEGPDHREVATQFLLLLLVAGAHTAEAQETWSDVGLSQDLT